MENQSFDWSNLFSHIGIRVRNENALSDITWALCKTYPKFQKCFLSFFFNDIDFDKNSIQLIREFPKTKKGVNGRVDFYFKINEAEYIIEVKIGDQNHHFSQYLTLFPNSKKKRGYITNYHLSYETNDYETRTWLSFYKRLKEKHKKDEVIMAYATYLKQVCNIFEVEKMNLSNLKSHTSFLFIIKETLNKNKNTTIKGKGSYHDGSSGKDFSLEFNEKKLLGWYGIIYNIKGASYISIYIKNGASLNFNFKRIDKYNLIGDAWNEDGFAYFTLNESKFNLEFTGVNIKLERQKIIIQDFLEEVILFTQSQIIK